MPAAARPMKEIQVDPTAAQLHQRRQQLQRALSGLRYAVDSLALTPKQRSALEVIIKEQSRFLAEIPKSSEVSRQKPREKAQKTRPSPEEQAQRTKEGQARKKARAELEKFARIRDAKREVQIDAVHKKSGYTEYQRRLPGSFESGSK